MTDTEHTLFKEVEADLEHQKLEDLWKQYGKLIIAAAILTVILTAGMTAYRAWVMENNQHLTSDLIKDSKADADLNTTIAALQKFADTNQGTHQADFALLQAGADAIDKNDKAKAITLFDAVANDDKADAAFRQLGDLLSVQVQLDEGDAKALSDRLQPLTEERQPWRYSALEDQGYLAMRLNDVAKARQIFADLSQDARTPPTISTRATDILRSLNN